MEIVRKHSVAWRQIRGEFLEAQDGKCAICGEPPIRASLDHCHQTGFLRGTLCTSCNVMLGWYETNRRAIETYLSRASEYIAHQPKPRATHRDLSPEERYRRHLSRPKAARPWPTQGASEG